MTISSFRWKTSSTSYGIAASTDVSPTLEREHGDPAIVSDRLAYSITPVGGQGAALQAEGFDASEDGTGRGVPLVPERFIPVVSDPIIAHEIKTYTHEGKSFRLRNCVTDEQHVHDISCDLDEDCMCSPSRFVGVRRLTPRECERLQGFPDDHTLVPHRGKEAMDGPRYRAIGNSMAVNAMRWIGRRIEQVEGKR